MIEPKHPRLSVSRQCLLLALPRATHYHQAKPVSPKTLHFMRLIDELYMLHEVAPRVRKSTVRLGDGLVGGGETTA